MTDPLDGHEAIQIGRHRGRAVDDLPASYLVDLHCQLVHSRHDLDPYRRALLVFLDAEIVDLVAEAERDEQDA